tara:strand:- start:1055 stop:1384 length:330 start_codon:yes stop_codon:yes gene_type:complete
MSFKLSDKQMKMLIEQQTAPPSPGDRLLWGTVDRKERKSKKKRDKVYGTDSREGLMDKYREALAAGKERKAARLKKRMDRKLRKADKKQFQADKIKNRPDYWMRRDETL